jgi:hypothetical protein
VASLAKTFSEENKKKYFNTPQKEKPEKTNNRKKIPLSSEFEFQI